MLVLPGSSALSDARFELLAAEISAVNQAYRLRETLFAYAVDLNASATLDAERLAALLHPGTAAAIDPDALSRPGLRIVVPRFGTISPWSSKATDIARNCGFDAVNRIERVVVVGIDGAPDAHPDPAIDALLHDRMVETVVDSLDALAPLFE